MNLFLALPVTKLKIAIARMLYRLVIIFYGRSPLVASRGGIVYELDLSEGIDLSVFLFGSFQKHITDNKLVRLNEDAVIIDVGANFGIISLQFAKVAKRGKVLAFEPTHYALAKFKRNLYLNPSLASRVILVNAFVSSTSGTNKKNLKAFSSWKVSGPDKERHPVHLGAIKSTEGVELINLDEFCANQKVGKIDFIKIDTDGHEFEVLKSCIRIIETYRPQIIFEVGLYIMKENNIDFTVFENFFSQFGYTLFDSKSSKIITQKNHRKHIPAKGSIDVLALPNIV